MAFTGLTCKSYPILANMPDKNESCFLLFFFFIVVTMFRECCFYNAFLKRALLGMMRMFEFQLAISLFSFFPSFVFVYIEDSLFVQRDLYTNWNIGDDNKNIVLLLLESRWVIKENIDRSRRMMIGMMIKMMIKMMISDDRLPRQRWNHEVSRHWPPKNALSFFLCNIYIGTIIEI